ncbi:MAG: hypothetical protein HN778_18840 [Prolixibacteraceae bacterium]|jgi:hypothetical protein|nr:hypothetical protein [Prolixibacteraceae bacterium]MBT6004217.1 hypothetical protein [Prolixibacteraceae bacterium]MBT6765507.1 hypothetical protein [Prolixibacteraceae bacterium]MBT6997052.1 hypothetical protein [Prolixibacteraceae bacterium]MBT7396893.1 hypothetical protein [Prolixibacteraceae bacterium]
MVEKSNSIKADYRTLIPEYSDEEILKILRKRKLYQPEAAEMAIQEAIKRELIHSEQDLFDKDFQVKPVRFLLFPTIENEKNIIKIRKSISRSLLISGLIPAIWGFLKLYNGKIIEGGVLAVLGVLWIYFSALLIRKADRGNVNSLLALLLLSVIYIVKLLLNPGTFIFMDIFIPAVIYGLISYGLLFLRRLNP